METKIRDIKEVNCPPSKIHHIRYITKNNVATTLCNETLMSDEWQYAGKNDKVNCPDCLLATMKREEVIRRPQRKNIPTKFYLGLGIVVVFAALYAVNYLFGLL